MTTGKGLPAPSNVRNSSTKPVVEDKSRSRKSITFIVVRQRRRFYGNAGSCAPGITEAPP